MGPWLPVDGVMESTGVNQLESTGVNQLESTGVTPWIIYARCLVVDVVGRCSHNRVFFVTIGYFLSQSGKVVLIRYSCLNRVSFVEV